MDLTEASRGKAKNSALLSSRDTGLLEPPERPQLTSLLFRLERGPGIALQAMQEKKALSSRVRGRLRCFLELRRPWGFSPEARRESQGASRAAPGKSGLHARARASASCLSSRGRGLGPRDALKKDSRSLVGGRRETLVSLAFCRGPSGTSQGASERRGILWSWR